MRILCHFLFILGILGLSFQGQAADIAVKNEAAAIDRFLQKDLLTLPTHYPSKQWIEDPIYAGVSGLYATNRLNYPKIPRIHSYNHSGQETYLSLQLPQELLYFAKQEDLNTLFHGTHIPKENIRVFFIAQNNLDADVLLRPHYFTDPVITTAKYNKATSVSVGVFPLAGISVTLAAQTSNALVNDSISSHPGADGIIASPHNLQIKGLEIGAESIFYSVTLIPSQRKAALTFHYLVGEIPPDEFLCTVDAATKISDLMHLPLFQDMVSLGFSGHLSQLASRRSQVK